MISRRLASIGGLLLLADFIVTAALSCLDAFHYFGFEDAVAAKKWAISAIFFIGVMNLFGPKHTGSIPVWLALPTLMIVAALIFGGVPHLAMCLPDKAGQHRNDLLRYMGEVFFGAQFAAAVGIVTGFLLLSAVNTAITVMVSLLYVMARNGELPEPMRLIVVG